MVQDGALLGVHGRLDRMVSVEQKYRRALDVASSGWLKALVVQDTTVALRCVETLKTMHLHPLKLIPLADLEDRGEIEPPKIEGIAGSACNFIRCRERFRPAVRFIFGDTIVTDSEKAAFLASRSGYRAVDLKGDLYEPNGVIVAGFYRAPIELLSLVPSRKAIIGLSESVSALDTIVNKRREDADYLESESSRLTEDRARREQLVSSIEGNIKSVERNIGQVMENARSLNKRIARFQEDLVKGEEAQNRFRMELEEQRKKLIRVTQERRSLRTQSSPENLGQHEVEHIQLNTEISDIHRRFTKIETDLKNLEDTLLTRLQPDHETTRMDLRTIDSQISSFEGRVSKASNMIKDLDRQLSDLNKAKDEISVSMNSVKDTRREFEVEFDMIEAQLRKLEQTNEPLNKESRRLELEVQVRKSEIGTS